MASKKTIEIVKSTAPLLEKYGEEITKVFYTHLFNKNPELRNVFNMVNQKRGTQIKALANAVFKYATYIDKLEMLGNMVEVIAQKHASLAIPKEAYPVVGENLLLAIKEVLGDVATQEVIDAWAEAYNDLAVIFINREESLYTSREQVKGGYRGMKQFKVVKKVKENENIVSIYLKRKDGLPVPYFKHGQYVAVSINIPNSEYKHTRNYSLSDSNNKDYLRLSIKKEEGSPEGIVSNYIHSKINVDSTLEVGVPSGEFVLNKTERPIVFISGGIGITPLLSMYKEASKSSISIIFIQCVLNSSTEVFTNELNRLSKNTIKNIKIFSEPLFSDALGKTHDYQGYLNLDILQDLNISNQSDFYFCGPTPFMANTLRILKDLKVEESQINYEFFGPVEELR